MRNEILRASAPILHKPTPLITEFGPSLDRLADKMFKMMKKAKGLGLAANQIGYMKRMFVFGEGNVIVNPMLVSGDTPVVDSEGCLSIPGKQFQVARFKNVTIVGFDLEGNGKEWTTSDLLARLFQHEIDHLNGKLITSHPEADGTYDGATL